MSVSVLCRHSSPGSKALLSLLSKLGGQPSWCLGKPVHPLSAGDSEMGWNLAVHCLGLELSMNFGGTEDKNRLNATQDSTAYIIHGASISWAPSFFSGAGKRYRMMVVFPKNKPMSTTACQWLTSEGSTRVFGVLEEHPSQDYSVLA